MRNLIEDAQAEKVEIVMNINRGMITFTGETFVVTKRFPRENVWKEVATLRKTIRDPEKTFRQHIEELEFEYLDYTERQE